MSGSSFWRTSTSPQMIHKDWFPWNHNIHRQNRRLYRLAQPALLYFDVLLVIIMRPFSGIGNLSILRIAGSDSVTLAVFVVALILQRVSAVIVFRAIAVVRIAVSTTFPPPRSRQTPTSQYSFSKPPGSCLFRPWHPWPKKWMAHSPSP